MSASNKKKLRKAEQAAALTDRQRAQQKEAKSLKAYTITFVVAMVLVVAVVLGVLLRTPVNSLINRNTKALRVGDHTLSTVDLSYYYTDAIQAYYANAYNSYYPYYGSYWSIFLGFSTSSPLNEQTYDSDEGTTWADYFMDLAIDNALSTYALYDKAMAEGYTLSEEEQAELDEGLASLSTDVSDSGYSSLNQYLRLNYCTGASKKSYTEYYKINTIASSYYSAYADSLEYTDEDYRAYEADQYDQYSTFSYNAYTVSASSYKTFLNLGTTTTDDDGNTSTTYTDEENEAALAAALADAQALVNGGYTTSEMLDLAIGLLDINVEKDQDSRPTSSAYTNFYSSVNSAYQEWIADDSREPGDMTYIPYTSTSTDEDGNETETTVGYYVVMFNERNDNLAHLIDVRHILVSFEGGTTDSDGNVTYSDEEKAAAKEEAEVLLEQWKNGDATEESFAALANEYSDDTGSNENGGLYENVYPGAMVTNFNDWCFDESRQPGDTGVVETSYGYHVMYFVQTRDMTYRDLLIENDMLSEDLEEWHDGLMDSYEVTRLNLKHMRWDLTLS